LQVVEDLPDRCDAQGHLVGGSVRLDTGEQDVNL